MTDRPPPNPIWETALDWLPLIQENPDDPELNGRLNHWRASAHQHDAGLGRGTPGRARQPLV